MVAQVIDMWISWLAKLVGPESTNRNSRETNTPNKCGARSGETPVKGLLHNKGGKCKSCTSVGCEDSHGRLGVTLLRVVIAICNPKWWSHSYHSPDRNKYDK